MGEDWVSDSSWVHTLVEAPDIDCVFPVVEGFGNAHITISLNMPSVPVVLRGDELLWFVWTDNLAFGKSVTIHGHESLIIQIHTIHIFHPLFWDIRNVDVVMDGLTEVVERSSKLFTLTGFLEFLESTVESLSLFVVESSIESLFEVLVPVGFLKVLVVLLDIIDSILESIHLGVVDMDTSWGLLNGFVEGLSELLPLFHEGLTFWRCLEFLIKGLEFVDLVRGSPLHGVFTDVLDNWRVLN